MEIRPIGFIESCYKQKFGTPRQSGLVEEARSVLTIESTYQPEISLDGLAEFSHVWVIFRFHALKDYSFHGKVHPPRLDGESIGLFASRSPHRPNPIGLSLVRLGKINGAQIELWGGDFVDGTPVLDIKPYLKEIESKPDAKSGWAQGKDHFINNLLFNYSPAVIEQMERSETLFKNCSITKDQFVKVIEDTIALDPRPKIYKDLDREHVIRLWLWDVFFTMDDQSVQILRLVRI